MTGEHDLLQDDVSALREQVRALEANNAALRTALHNTALRTDVFDNGPCWCEYKRSCELDRHGPDCWPVRELLNAPHPGAALLAEMEGLRKRNEESKAAHMLLDRAGESPVQADISERVRVLLEKRNALLEQVRSLTEERDAALAKAAIWEKAAGLARDAALEEVAKVFAETLRAELEVGDRLRAKGRTDRAAENEHAVRVLRQAATRLGLTLDGEKTS
jgi:hypothetical protein